MSKNIRQSPDTTSTVGSTEKCPLKDFQLRFELMTETGVAVSDAPYKTALSGSAVDDLHLEDAKTDASGQTAVVSETSGEAIDFYLVWAKVKVNKGFLKT